MKALNVDNFETEIQGSTSAVVDVWGTW